MHLEVKVGGKARTRSCGPSCQTEVLRRMGDHGPVGQWGATEGSGERETVSFLEVNLVTAVCWVEWVRWRWGPLRRFFRG